MRGKWILWVGVLLGLMVALWWSLKNEPPEYECALPADPYVAPLLFPLPANGVDPRRKVDLSQWSADRRPWDNYVQSDSLVEKLQADGVLPPPKAPPGQEGALASPYSHLIQQGRVPFPLVHQLYRMGKIGRDGDKRKEVLAALRAEVAARKTSDVAQVNLILALIHIGYEEEARAEIGAAKDEAWFAKNWDANFFAGTLLFRHREYEEAAHLLERAHALHPEKWSRLWLQLALEASGKAPKEPLFVFGKHMGVNANAATGKEWVFSDQADKWGVRRWALAGALAFEDYNNDTWIDLVANGVHAAPEFFIHIPGQGLGWRGDKALSEAGNVPPACVAADFDNDGYTDLFMTRAAWFGNGPNRLFRNVNGTQFEDVSLASDVALNDQNSCGATALDFNRDGLVDLAVSGTSGGSLRILKNTGDMKFTDVTREVGVLPTQVVAVSVAAGDLNGDGWPDLFVNTRSHPADKEARPGDGPNQLYLNDGKGHFVECAQERGVADGTTQGFGSWFFDYDNDGDLDILASNFTDEDFVGVLEGFEAERDWEGFYLGSALYENQGDAHFKNVGKEAGFVPASVMGAQWIDYNLDGHLDVVLGPGSHPLKNMQPLLVYRNNGDKTFTNVSPLMDPTLFGKFHGIAFSDVDRDGDPDLYVNNGGVLLSDRWRDLFLENQTEGQNWLHLKLVGIQSNRSAIDARVTVRSGKDVWVQERRAGQGFSSTNGPYLIFGLGKRSVVDEVTIQWPSGQEQKLPPLAVNQALQILEGSANYRRDY